MEQKTKKIVLILLAGMAALLLLAAGWALMFAGQFGVYQDSKFHFKIKYPRAWRVAKHPPHDASAPASVAVIFVSPKESALDVLQENFNVTVQPVPDHLATISSFSSKIKEQMTAVFNNNITIVEDKPMRWGSHLGHLMVFEAPKPDSLILVTAWVFKRGQAYILTFIGDMRRYPKQYAPLVDTMIQSFQLK